MTAADVIGFIGAIIGAILGAMLPIAWDRYRRSQGTKVCVKKIYQNQQSQTFIQYIRQNLDTRYKGEPIDNAVISVLNIENTGDTIEKPLTLEIYATPRDEGDTIEFITTNIKDPLNITTLDYEGTAVAPIIRLSRPFFNSIISQAEEIVSLSLWSNVDLKFEVKGGGIGWYAKYYDEAEPPSYTRSFFSCSFWTLLLFVSTIMAIYMFRALIPFVSNTSATSGRLFLFGLVYGIIYAGILGIILSNIRQARSNMGRRLYRTLDESK